MALSSTSYLEEKQIPLEKLKRVCSTPVEAKVGKFPMLNEAGEIADHYRGPILYTRLVDAMGQDCGCEQILDEKVSLYPGRKPDNKYLRKGSSTVGFRAIGFHPKDLASMTGRLIVNAGLADAYRLHEATGLPVASGVGEANIGKIIKAIRTVIWFHGSDLEVIATADNDPAGIRACVRSNAPWVVPKELNDWSDLAQDSGPTAVREQFGNINPAVELDRVDAVLESMGLSQISSGGAPAKSSFNQFIIKQNPNASLGIEVAARIQSEACLKHLNAYMAIAERAGYQREHQGKTVLHSNNADGHAFMMTLLHDELMGSLNDKGKVNAEAFSKAVLAGMELGEFSAIEPMSAGPTVLRTSCSNSAGLKLHFEGAICQQFIAIMHELSGVWEKQSKEWVIRPSAPEDINNALQLIASRYAGRVVFLPNQQSAMPIAVFPGALPRIAQALAPEVEWLTRNHNVLQDVKVKPEATLQEEGGRKFIMLKFEDAKDNSIKPQLKEMDATFKDGYWKIALSESSLRFMEEIAPKWRDDGALEEASSYVKANGFGFITPIGGDRFMLKAPYSALLSTELKQGLPRLAREFNKDLEFWEIHVASGAIAEAVQDMMLRFDIRVTMVNDGQLTTFRKGEGLDYIAPGLPIDNGKKVNFSSGVGATSSQPPAKASPASRGMEC